MTHYRLWGLESVVYGELVTSAMDVEMLVRLHLNHLIQHWSQAEWTVLRGEELQ